MLRSSRLCGNHRWNGGAERTVSKVPKRSEGHCQTVIVREPLSEGHCQTARLLSDTQGNGGAEHLFHSYGLSPLLRYYFEQLRNAVLLRVTFSYIVGFVVFMLCITLSVC